MNYDIVIVGAGISGLTSSAFLSKSGYSVLLCEKEDKVGGLVNSFDRGGFIFDGGIRATENSGILFPMLRQLELEIDFVKNKVSIGFEKDVIRLNGIGSINKYQELLYKLFQHDHDDILKIVSEIKKIMKYMDVLYDIDNPVFLDIKKDRSYFIKVILPWLIKYIMTIRKIQSLDIPVEEYLNRFTKNKILIDMIAQHFFKKTPAFFALGYFKIYNDYYYPKGGTGILPKKLEDCIIGFGGKIKLNTEIIEIEPELHRVKDTHDNTYTYKKLIWAADLRSFYKKININSIRDFKVKQNIISKQRVLLDKKGGDSVFTLYLCVDIDKKYFNNISTEHFFYTPHIKGLSNISKSELDNKEKIIEWIKEYLKFTTYEISCPVMRDKNLAPVGKTGLIISALFDYSLTKKIFEMGWYKEFKIISEKIIINTLNSTIYPGIKNKIIDQFSSTPLTISRKYGTSDGAITGWAFTNEEIPAEARLLKIANSPNNPVPDVFQVGQWAFSPSGLPTSILTGKIAATKIQKQLK